MTLDPQYKNCIDSSKRSFLDIKTNVTHKFHAVLFHIEDFCDLSGTSGLGFFREQAWTPLIIKISIFWSINFQYIIISLL